ncbi:MAG: reverse transcriptase family protein, partial [Sedimenticola sp.]
MLDSGAEVSLINRRVYDSLKSKPKLSKKQLNLSTAGGTPLHLDGCAELTFEIGGLCMSHTFYVVRNLSRNIILGQDWLRARGVRVYHDLGCIRLNKTYIPMVEDIHVASVVRATRKTKIKAQSAHICTCKVRRNPNLTENQVYEISPIDNGYLSHEPGLMIPNTIAKMNANRQIQIMIVNTTNKTHALKKGMTLARIQAIPGAVISSVEKTLPTLNHKMDQMTDNKAKPSNYFEDVDAPEHVRDRVSAILRGNSDLFATTDAELSHTDTVRMKIDTGNSPPIKLRPYRTPLNNRKVIDKAVDEMLDAKIIEHSRSPWSFPVVIVDKKDGSKRFCVDFRALNKVTKTNSYPLPLIDDILALLGKAKYFTSLDLKSGYWQVLMDESDREKTA